ncbi:MAG: alpha-amylase family glycosyl hydrolase [Eubacteriales bacterium]|nr:alpha-amylase family glycosyl hydrolase [Eubacteriales bacterium]
MSAKKTTDPFEQRLKAHEAELHQIYTELYHDENAYNYFCEMLKRMYSERRSCLKDIDKAREADPGWYKRQDRLGMQIYTQCFGGTLKGVQEHLDYIQESGVNYLHLMPLLESPKEKSDGGYAVSDFRKVNPELGTMEDLAALTDECHERDVAVCIDFVMNHTSDEHEWARKAKAGEVEYQQRYFFYDNWDIPTLYEETVPQVFPTTAPGNFTWCAEANKVVMTFFYPFQWDLNYCNPTVLNDMTENMLYLCNQGIDVIRLDAVPYIWKALHTDCRNQPQVHTLVRLLNLAAQVVCPGVLLLGEVVMEPDKVVPYFGTTDSPECHMLYNVTTMCTTWHTVATQDARLIRRQMDTVFALPSQYTFLNYLRCHDDIGWGLDYQFLKQFGISEVPHKKFLSDYFCGHVFGSESRGELYNDDPRLGDARQCGTTASLCGMETGSEASRQLDIMLHAFLLTQSGLPIIYSGDELGQLNDYSYHNDPIKCEDSRYLHRGNFDWNAAEKRDENSIYPALRKLEKLRASEPAFHADADTWTLDTFNDSILAIGRYYNGEKLLAVFNFSRDWQTAHLNQYETYEDLLTGEEMSANSLHMWPYEFRWLVKRYN